MKKIIILFSTFILFGCLSGKHDYQPPTTLARVENSITLNKSKDEVWKKMVNSIGTSFFVVNNLDKDSGFINVSYSGDPCRYVDCGWIKSDVSNAAGKRNYNFPACRQHKEYEYTNKGYLIWVNRKMDLEGRINIIIQEESKNETRLTVNARYIVTKNIRGQAIGTNKTETFNDTISFNSGGSSSFPHGTTCSCNGKLEKEILGMAQ
jgi:hypothetical protein